MVVIPRLNPSGGRSACATSKSAPKTAATAEPASSSKAATAAKPASRSASGTAPGSAPGSRSICICLRLRDTYRDRA
jgi:hypothetical protein